ncbi:cell division protein DivIVC [Chryseomicrobium excrementi]|uniref:Cell division protein DivIVC n=1 Tax=Chryseomicrobium excrementi TaxID=2041346 RepID=A0A2M9EWQ7_9BACL|nr:septum formation initiator family protein [Chryseomicrobium excrementi]PJK15645.1 cell division protein DivIVC [Chryseomicrobium excrementi]
MSQNERTNQLEQQISSINSEYVRSVQKKKKRQHAQRVRLYRRLAAFAVVASLIIGFLVHSLLESQRTLAEKKATQIEVEQSLVETTEEKESLELQIAKLNDDEYIGKLLRKDYFLSEENELIFTLPKDDQDKESDD